MGVKEFLEDISALTGIPVEDLYCTRNGKRVTEDDTQEGGAPLRWAVRLCGGKGGFGSMLRAIGAQIEKTTNREACRDLSGRRLRDIREEQRLRDWAAQRQQREEEEQKRREEKQKKQVEPPKFEFKDEAYEKARSTLEEAVDSAVEKGYQVAGTSGVKPCSKQAPKRKSAKLWIDDDISDLSSDSSDEENSSESVDNSENSRSSSGEPAEKRPRTLTAALDNKTITA